MLFFLFQPSAIDIARTLSKVETVTSDVSIVETASATVLKFASTSRLVRADPFAVVVPGTVGVADARYVIYVGIYFTMFLIRSANSFTVVFSESI